MRQSLAEAAAKSSPPAALVVWNAISGIPAEKWLTYLTIGYVVLQALILFRDKVLRDRSTPRKGSRK
jgi:hypothetical protein